MRYENFRNLREQNGVQRATVDEVEKGLFGLRRRTVEIIKSKGTTYWREAISGKFTLGHEVEDLGRAAELHKTFEGKQP